MNPVLRLSIAAALATGCGDPLLDGGDPGPPSIVLEGRILGLDPSDANRPATAALIWTTPFEVPEVFEQQAVTLVADDVGAFQLQVFGRPDRRTVEPLETLEADADPPAIALGFLAVLDGEQFPFMRADDLSDTVRGAASDHYLLWVHRPDAARAALTDLVLNPDELAEGLNLVLGLCRPGRESQLLVVPPERIAVLSLSETKPGTCLDVFWGDWR